LLGDVFGCMFAVATENPFNTLWGLWFYDRVVFTAFTERVNQEHAEDAAEAEQESSTGRAQGARQ
jgi:hypothetical protein